MRISKEDHKLISETFDQIANKQQLDEIKAIDAVHLGLDVAGMVPVFGAAADLTNAALYGIRGKGGMAALSAAAAVPIVGQAAMAGKLATRFGGGVGKVAKSLTPTAAATRKTVKTTKSAQKASIAAGKEAKQAGKAAIEGGGMFGSAKGLVTAAKNRVAAKAAVKSARKAAPGVVKRAATRGKVYKNILGGPGGTGRYGLARAGVLARGDVAQTYGFNDPKTPAKDVQLGIPFTGGRVPGEGAAAVDNLTSKIYDTLKKGAKGLEGAELGSFQPRKVT